jgi:hypothetical protein
MQSNLSISIISASCLRARIKASEVIASTTSIGMGFDGDDVDEILGLADAMLEVVGMLGGEGVGGLLDLLSLEKTFEMTLRSLDIVFVR